MGCDHYSPGVGTAGTQSQNKEQGGTGLSGTGKADEHYGSIKEAKLMGGHPLLANAALDAIKQWRFEPAPGETTGTVEFRFDPTR
jgi:hypothetical protein